MVFLTGWVCCDGHRYDSSAPPCGAETGVTLEERWVSAETRTGRTQHFVVARYHNSSWSSEQRWLDEHGRQRGACVGNFCSRHKEVR